RRVLDVFSYLGAWGIQAAVAGAAEVSCVDASAAALDGLQRNAAASGVSDRVDATGGDAFEVMRSMHADVKTYDVVVVDPPAFIKRRKDIKTGEQGYLRLNRLAVQLLAPGGILISCSCSMHLAEARLQSIVHQAAGQQGRRLQILERGFQAPDHPVHPAIPETAYLKALFCRLPGA
ncbi:MAG TPA: class I SAM-dependent methyltransferase, partial [Gammaproteobacteria bacterium]|nr:class I SAM-dependent methyltransferase [Gammaproteobacteria bacterium]